MSHTKLIHLNCSTRFLDARCFSQVSTLTADSRITITKTYWAYTCVS